MPLQSLPGASRLPPMQPCHCIHRPLHCCSTGLSDSPSLMLLWWDMIYSVLFSGLCCFYFALVVYSLLWSLLVFCPCWFRLYLLFSFNEISNSAKKKRWVGGWKYSVCVKDGFLGLIELLIGWISRMIWFTLVVTVAVRNSSRCTGSIGVFPMLIGLGLLCWIGPECW